MTGKSAAPLQASRLRAETANPSAGRLNRFVFAALLAVIPLSVIPYGTVDPWWESAFESFVFFLTAIWMFEVVLSRGWQIKRVSVLLPMIAITAYAFLQAVQWPPAWLIKTSSQHMLSIDHYQTYLTARKTLALTLFFGMLLVHASSVQRLRWIVRMVIAVGLGSAAFGITRQFVQASDSTGGFILPFLFYGSGYGQFISPNAFAFLMEMTLGLLAGLVLGGGLRKNRLLIYLAIMTVVWTALVLSNSRGGLISLACQAIFVFFVGLNWYSERRLSRGNGPNKLISFIRGSKLVRAAAVVLVLATLSVGVLWMGGEDLTNKLQTSTMSQEGDGTTRVEIWRASWKLFKDRPWTGTGFGAYFLGIPQFELSSGRIRVEQAHNDYLDLAASGGVFGLVLSAWFVAMVLWNARFNLQNHRGYERAAVLGAASAALGVGIHSVVDFGLQLTGIAVVFAALIVVLVAEVAPEVRELSDNVRPGQWESRRRRRSVGV